MSLCNTQTGFWVETRARNEVQVCIIDLLTDKSLIFEMMRHFEIFENVRLNSSNRHCWICENLAYVLSTTNRFQNPPSFFLHSPAHTSSLYPSASCIFPSFLLFIYPNRSLSLYLPCIAFFPFLLLHLFFHSFIRFIYTFFPSFFFLSFLLSFHVLLFLCVFSVFARLKITLSASVYATRCSFVFKHYADDEWKL